MIEHFLLIPTMLYATQDNSSLIDLIAKDISVILLVNVLEKAGLTIFRRVFVSIMIFGLITEILNDLFYKAIASNPLYLENWKYVHKHQTQALINALESFKAKQKKNTLASFS